MDTGESASGAVGVLGMLESESLLCHRAIGAPLSLLDFLIGCIIFLVAQQNS